ncbi:response regulator transcription factor [Allohahella sp. A8]|uniref:response regulator transcription factor n=1 Tax=Allohahella sp. A8 TaxID=3141461 RepID=UPI003A7FE066
MTGIYLIDDNEAFRTSVQWSLEDLEFTVRSFASATDFLAFLQTESAARPAPRDEAAASEEPIEPMPWCIVSDVRMPDMSGMELLDALWRIQSTLPIVLMSGHADIPLAVEAMAKGAAHVLEKPFELDVLAKVVTLVAQQPLGGPRNPDDARSRLEKLSPRESEVLALICAGCLNKTIADTLGISVKTVELHRAKLSNKLGAKNIHELIKISLGYT